MAAVHRIMGDFYEDPFHLVAIHSCLEDYELAYFINLYLGTRFKRSRDDLRPTGERSFPIFEWKDTKNDRYWSLVANNSTWEEDTARNDLFDREPSFTRHHLVPEYKEVDFFLKIEQDDLNIEAEVLRTLLRTSKIIAAYMVRTDTLKSRNNLIFV